MNFIHDSRYWKSFNIKDLSQNPIIDFYNPENITNGFLSNSFASKMIIDGKEYATAEHYYQAQKFTSNEELFEKVRSASSPAEAKAVSRLFPKKVDPAWDLKRVAIMKKAVLEKFKQNPDLVLLLFLTEAAILRKLIPDDAPTDKFWGWNPTKGGSNMAGKILMAIRMEIGGYDAFGICYTTVLVRNGKEHIFAVSKGMQHMAVIVPPKTANGLQSKSPAVRVHSRCWTGDVFESVQCDCRSQLWRSIEKIEDDEAGGVVLYLDQEGRGSGIVPKIRGYNLSKHGFDTVTAYQLQGLDPDVREYNEAAEILKRLGIAKVRLMTNNQYKENALVKNGIEVEESIRMPVEEYNLNCYSKKYFETKIQKLGHHRALING